MPIQPFEIIGYSKDFYLGSKFIGYVNVKEKDRETIGYYGRKTEILQEDLKLGSKKFKAGIEVMTELNTSCGRILHEYEYLIRPNEKHI